MEIEDILHEFENFRHMIV